MQLFTFAQTSAESVIVFWHIGGLLLNCFSSLCIPSSPDSGGRGLGTVGEMLFPICSRSLWHCPLCDDVSPIHWLFPIFLFMITCSRSLIPSCPHPLAEDIWWFDLHFLSQRHVWQMHNYCAKNIIRPVLCLLLDWLCSLTFKQ